MNLEKNMDDSEPNDMYDVRLILYMCGEKITVNPNKTFNSYSITNLRIQIAIYASKC